MEKQPAASMKTSTKRMHPPYFDMIKDAISSLKNKTGSSQYAIAKVVEEKQKNLPEKFKRILLIQLRRLVAQGKLVKVKASYKLPKAKPKPASTANPKAAAKPRAISKAKAAAPKVVEKLAPKAKPKTPIKPVAKTSRPGQKGRR